MAESPNAAISTAVSLISTPLDGATVTSTGANAGDSPKRRERRTAWPTTSPSTGTTRLRAAHQALPRGAEAEHRLKPKPGLARPGSRPCPPTSRDRRIVILSSLGDQRGHGPDPAPDRVSGKPPTTKTTSRDAAALRRATNNVTLASGRG